MSRDDGRTPTLRTNSAQSSIESVPTGAHSLPSSGAPLVVFIVTDIRYPTPQDFDLNKGSFRIDSVHSSKKNANARAKKIIYDGGRVDGSQFNVDSDKIIEDLPKGLFVGIGIGGKGDGREMGCYARKCQVERKMVDEDSEDEGDGEGEDERDGDGIGSEDFAGVDGVDGVDGDVDMG